MNDFVAGCVGGFAGILVGHPFDTIKVRLQNQNSLAPKYTSTWNCVKQVITKESVFAVYKGLSSPLYGQIFINAVVFGIHGYTLRFLKKENAKTQFLAGGAAGCVQSLIASPMELVKIRFQMQGEGESKVHICKKDMRYHYKSSFDCFKKIYKYEGGIHGVFRGLNMTMWREIPSFGTYFASYFYLCEKTCAIENEDRKPNIMKLLLCGGCAGIISWIVTYPADVIKTRQQMDGIKGKALYKNAFDCAVKSCKGEGIAVLFRGLNITLLRAFPTNAATLSTVTLYLHYTTN